MIIKLDYNIRRLVKHQPFFIYIGSFLKHCCYLNKVITNNYRLKDHFTFNHEKSATNSIRNAESFTPTNKLYENSLSLRITRTYCIGGI